MYTCVLNNIYNNPSNINPFVSDNPNEISGFSYSCRPYKNHLVNYSWVPNNSKRLK